MHTITKVLTYNDWARYHSLPYYSEEPIGRLIIRSNDPLVHDRIQSVVSIALCHLNHFINNRPGPIYGWLLLDSQGIEYELIFNDGGVLAMFMNGVAYRSREGEPESSITHSPQL